MVDPEIVEEWLNRAVADFDFAQVNLEEGRTFFPQICFHFQQSAEKFLKAYIVANGLQFRKTHDLPLLLSTCSDHDPSLQGLRDDCEFLNTFYIETRYPVHWPMQFSLEDAARCREAAKNIRLQIEKRLKNTMP